MLRSTGFSLIELIVSLLLISITLLGTARLQLFAQQNIEFAHHSGQALQLIEEASVRIYLNRKNINSYRVAELEKVLSYHCNPCKPSELVQLDLSHLSVTLSKVLPAATASIHDCSAGLCMTVAWQGNKPKACHEVRECIERPLL